jgi:hypothetical protein
MRRVAVIVGLLLGCEAMVASHEGPCVEKFAARDEAQHAADRAASVYDGACRKNGGHECEKLPEHDALERAYRKQSEAQAAANHCTMKLGTLSPITP